MSRHPNEQMDCDDMDGAAKERMPEPPDWDNVLFKQLKKGELVEEGDWVDMARDGWRDDPKWVPATRIGETAPDPAYPSHRVFRRVLCPSDRYSDTQLIERWTDRIGRNESNLVYAQGIRDCITDLRIRNMMRNSNVDLFCALQIYETANFRPWDKGAAISRYHNHSSTNRAVKEIARLIRQHQ